MKIALLSPPLVYVESSTRVKNSFIFPSGLGYLAAYLRRAGHTIRIYDFESCGVPLEEIWKQVAEFAPDITGITAVTLNFTSAKELAAEARRRLGGLVIMGGMHATALPRSTLQAVPALDAVIIGEGELPMLALAAEFDARGKVDFSRIPGAAFIESGKYRENARPDPIVDLDGLPYPARDLVDIRSYYQHHRSYGGAESTMIISSRGCPGQCTFCANISMGRKFRAHSPAYFVGEIEYLMENYGRRHFKISDDCFTADTSRVAEICDLIVAKRLDITWSALGRVNTLRDDRVIRKMKRAGCVYVGMGIETGSQRINELMRKGTTLEMAEESCALLRKHGIPYTNSFIIGNEGDTEETVAATVAFAKKLKADTAIFNMLIPYPGTPLFDKYYKDYDTPETDWRYWCSEAGNRPYEPRQTALSKKDILRLRDRAYWQYYGNPFQLLRTVLFGMKF